MHEQTKLIDHSVQNSKHVCCFTSAARTHSLNNNNPPSADIFSPVKVNSTGFMLTGAKSKSAGEKFLALQLLAESGCFVSLLFFEARRLQLLNFSRHDA